MIHIKRVDVEGEAWFQINNTSVCIDAESLQFLVARGVEVIDDDCIRVERERQARWN